MPAPFPEGFRRRAVELVREGDKSIPKLAENLGTSESRLRRWVAQADIDDGSKPGVALGELAELRRLRKENRVLKMERDLLSRAAASSPRRMSCRSDLSVHECGFDSDRLVPRCSPLPEPGLGHGFLTEEDF